MVGGTKVFSGVLWAGAQARDLGLIDGLGDAGMVAHEVVGAEALVDYLPVHDPLGGWWGVWPRSLRKTSIFRPWLPFPVSSQRVRYKLATANIRSRVD